MKISSVLSAVCILMIVGGGTSCNKVIPGDNPDNIKKIPGAVFNNPESTRKIQFLLYTDKDFSDDNHDIFFTVSIKDTSGRVLWDSALAPMKIKDIPALANKISIEKNMPGNDLSELRVGFYYYMGNVGYSWYLGILKAGIMSTTLDYNFQ